MKEKPVFVVMVLVMCLFAPCVVDAGNSQGGSSTNGGITVFEEKGSEGLPSGVSRSWWAEVGENLRKSEYELTVVGKNYMEGVGWSYQAPNRAHNLQTYFTEEGIRVIPRRAKDHEWNWRLSLRAWGVEGDLRGVEKPSVSVLGNRIEYGRNGLTEWYVNDNRGLEQGFTVRNAPGGTGGSCGKWLVLRMDVSGDLTGTLQPGGEGVEFRTRDGIGVLSYGHLRAKDSIGRELVAKLELEGNILEVLVDTTDAAYPLHIDPLATAPNWTAESNQDYALFGYSVSTAGDVNGDGYSDVIVGAPFYDNGHEDEGRVFIYYGSATGLSTSPNWSAESDKSGAYFGNSVSTAGDVNGDGYSDVIVGAYQYSNGQAWEGRAFVYHGSATGLSTSPNWSAESNQSGAYFGYSVSTAGDVNGDGYSDVIVGASQYDNGQDYEGRVFVYYGSPAGLSTSPNWSAESDQAYARLGMSVSTAGDVNRDGYSDVIVGAPYYSNGESYEGRVLVYYGSPAGLSTSPNWSAESDQASAGLGMSVSTAGDVNGDGFSDVIVGAPYYSNPEGYEGRVFVYHGSATGLSTSPNWSAESDTYYAYFGYSVSTAGDVNGDSYSDVIVGASQYSHGQTYEGRAFVFHGSATGLSASFDWSAEPEQTEAYFGYSVSTAGDVNGDGYSDVIVGASGYDNGQTNEGRAFIYHGSSAGPADSDADGLPDSLELATGTNPNDADTDDDGIIDGLEDANHNGIVDASETDPRKADTDADAMPDGWEKQYGLNPLVNDASGDKDGDGFSNLQEYKAGTDPTDAASKPRPAAMPWLPLLLDD